jgi:hypothetical protein
MLSHFLQHLRSLLSVQTIRKLVIMGRIYQPDKKAVVTAPFSFFLCNVKKLYNLDMFYFGTLSFCCITYFVYTASVQLMNSSLWVNYTHNLKNKLQHLYFNVFYLVTYNFSLSYLFCPESIQTTIK